VLIAIFAVQRNFFGVEDKKISVCSTDFCGKFATFWCKFLTPYGVSFAALCHVLCRLM